MKNLIGLLFMFLLIVSLASCSQSASDMIAGEWQISDIKTTSDIPEDQMESYNAQIEDMKNSSKIIFKADGTYEQTILDEVGNGKWEVSEDGKVLTTEVDGNKEVKQVQELSPEKMVLVLAFDSDTITTTFEKIK